MRSDLRLIGGSFSGKSLCGSDGQGDADRTRDFIKRCAGGSYRYSCEYDSESGKGITFLLLLDDLSYRLVPAPVDLCAVCGWLSVADAMHKHFNVYRGNRVVLNVR